MLSTDGEDVCEICERPGHDIFSCEMLGGTTSPTLMMSRITGSDDPAPLGASVVTPEDDVLDVFCEDCEGHGHVAADCPHSLDVF